MNKKNIMYLSVLILLFVIAGIYSYNNKVSHEYLVKVKESYDNYSLAYILDDKNDALVKINVGDLNEDDILEITTNEDIKDNNIIVSDYKYIHQNKMVNKLVNDREDKQTISVDKNETIQNIPKDNNVKIISNTKQNNNKNKISITNKDEYITDLLSKEITLLEQNYEKSNIKENAKKSFIKTVDFIFYDKDINGIYFKDLTNKAKITVMKLFLKLDSLINKYYPDYKNEVSDKYHNTKEKLISLYLKKTDEYCANHDDVCEEAKSDFLQLKTSINITWDTIKSLGKYGISKLKDWYEIYSGK